MIGTIDNRHDRNGFPRASRELDGRSTALMKQHGFAAKTLP
jgi:hypothetical protein